MTTSCDTDNTKIKANRKQVCFSDKELEVYGQFLASKGKFSTYVKKLIEQDFNNSQTNSKDLSSLELKLDELKDFICERSGLYVSSGSAYRSNGGFLRFNIACPQKMLEDGLKRLEKSVKEWKCS